MLHLRRKKLMERMAVSSNHNAKAVRAETETAAETEDAAEAATVDVAVIVTANVGPALSSRGPKQHLNLNPRILRLLN